VECHGQPYSSQTIKCNSGPELVGMWSTTAAFPCPLHVRECRNCQSVAAFSVSPMLQSHIATDSRI